MITMIMEVVFYCAAILGINVFTIFFLLLSKWWKTFMSFSIAGFFVVVTATLDLSAMARFFPKTLPFVLVIDAPVLFVLALSSWTLVTSFFIVQLAKPKKENGKVDKVDVEIPKM